MLSLCKFINIYSILQTICLYVVDLFYIWINCLKRNEQKRIKKNVFLFDFMDSTFLYIIFSFFVQKYIHFRLEWIDFFLFKVLQVKSKQTNKPYAIKVSLN